MIFQEKRLMKSLSKFDVDLTAKYVVAAQSLLKESLKVEPSIAKISDGGTTIAFRFTMPTPVYVMLSHPICRFRSSRKYVVNPTSERYFAAEMGLIPVYLASFNRMSMLKTWGETTKLFFDPNNAPMNENSSVCWEIGPSERSPVLSSMNFILKNTSPFTAADEATTSMMEKYFSNFFWELQFDTSRSTHFLHFADKITGAINVSKTLFVVKEIRGTREIEIQHKSIRCYDMLVSGIFKGRSGYYMKQINVLMEVTTAKDLKIDEVVNRGFFNGIVAEVKRRNQIVLLFQVVDSYATADFELLNTLIGFISADMFRRTKSLSYVGYADSVKEEVERAFDLLVRETNMDTTLGGMLDNWFERALNEMFPILLVKDKCLFYVHPLTWSFFKKMSIPYIPNPQDPMLQNLMTIVDTILKISPMKLRMMDELDSFRSLVSNMEQLKRDIRSLAHSIRLAKTLNGTYVQG